MPYSLFTNVFPSLLVLYKNIVSKIHCNYRNQASFPKESLFKNKLKPIATTTTLKAYMSACFTATCENATGKFL